MLSTSPCLIMRTHELTSCLYSKRSYSIILEAFLLFSCMTIRIRARNDILYYLIVEFSSIMYASKSRLSGHYFTMISMVCNRMSICIVAHLLHLDIFLRNRPTKYFRNLRPILYPLLYVHVHSRVALISAITVRYL